MDSVHKLIEMLEGRFGKFWADALLLCAVLGAAAWGINSFVSLFLTPTAKLLVAVYGYILGVHISLPSNLAEILFGISIPFQIIALVGSILVFRRNNKITNMLDLTKSDMEKTNLDLDSLIAKIRENENEYERIIADLRRQNAALAARHSPEIGS
jgi:hypothetical protein